MARLVGILSVLIKPSFIVKMQKLVVDSTQSTANQPEKTNIAI